MDYGYWGQNWELYVTMKAKSETMDKVSTLNQET